MKSAFNIVGLAMGWSKLWIVPLSMMALLSACSGSEEEAQIEQPVDELYNLALDTALSGDTKAAAPLFEEVERQHPYSIWAVRARIVT